nr:glutaminyl-peptide cyclotransferase [Chromatium okenii]
MTVHDGERPITALNELEWIDGEIWANVWQQDVIARIDPASGAVNSWLNLRFIASRCAI